jgi:hypothetical protein
MERKETFTIHTDSTGQTANSFQVYLNIPLKTVVKAELLSVNLSSNTTVATSNISYVIVNELISRFNDKTLPAVVESLNNTSDPFKTTNTGGTVATTNPPLTTSNISNMQRSFIKLDMEQVNKRTLYSKGANFESTTDYIQPIQQLDKLTITIYDERGVPIVTNGPSYLTFRFTCARDNMYKY